MSMLVCKHDAQLRVVRAVAVLGGLLQMFLFMCLSGLAALVMSFLTWEIFQFSLINGYFTSISVFFSFLSLSLFILIIVFQKNVL